jgi:hypothetical protein
VSDLHFDFLSANIPSRARGEMAICEICEREGSTVGMVGMEAIKKCPNISVQAEKKDIQIPGRREH